MKKTAVIIFGSALAAAPAMLGQTAPPAQPARVNVEQQLKQQLKQMEETMHTMALKTGDGADTFVFVGGQLFNGNPVKGQPFSAEAVTETTQVLGDGNKIVNRSSTMRFRDSEGRERREESIGKIGSFTTSGEPAKVVFISDPVASMSYTLHTAEHTAEKRGVHTNAVFTARGGGGAAAGPVAITHSNSFEYNLTTDAGTADAQVVKLRAELAAQSAVAAAGGRGGVMTAGAPVMRKSLGKTESLGKQNIEGVIADGTRTTVTIPAGQIGNEREINIVSESWYSPELQMVVMTKHSDPRTGDNVFKLTNLSRAEPSHTLFEIPGDYKVNEPTAPRAVRVVKEDQ